LPPPGYASAAGALRAFLLSDKHLPLTSENTDYLNSTANIDLLEESSALAFVATRDTNAEAAWDMGWTGRGVKVGHLDDFATKEIPSEVSGRNLSHGDATLSVTYQVSPEMTHATRQLTFDCDVSSLQQHQQTQTGYQYFSDNGFHIVNNSFGISRYYTAPCGGTPGLYSNTDWASAIDSTLTDPVFLNMAGAINDTTSYDENMLFVFSAGNEGEFCRDGTGACNLQAAAILKLRETEPTAGARVLYVGSLSDASSVSEITGLPKALAPYSHTAGDMKNDYIVAHDDIFYYQQGIGTSFAAPRVVGAAALVRQKFPTLNGANLKQVLLQSADDLGAPGVDEIFGHGQLNVINALSPIDGLSE
jgi:subtilisin family serine protease